MTSAFFAPLPPAHSYRNLSLAGQQLMLNCEAQLEVLTADGIRYNEQPVIENYYCQLRAGELVKVTLVRIGKEVLRLTDRIVVYNEQNQEEDDRTKSSSNTSQPEASPQMPKQRRTYFSKSAKALLLSFQKWAKDNDCSSSHSIVALRIDYPSE